METTTLAAIAESTTAAATEAAGSAFSFTPEGFLNTLPIMGKGMLGIFIVIGIIILCVALLNNLTAPDRKEKQAAKRAAQTEKRAEKLKSKNQDK